MIWASIILSILGVFDAAYLTAEHYLNNSVYCPVGANCETVLNSKYSVFLGLPISLFGLVFYFSLLILFLVFFHTEKKIILKTAFTIALAGLLISIYFTYLQFFVLYAYCVYCLFSAANTAVIFFITARLLVFAKKQSII